MVYLILLGALLYLYMTICFLNEMYRRKKRNYLTRWYKYNIDRVSIFLRQIDEERENGYVLLRLDRKKFSEREIDDFIQYLKFVEKLKVDQTEIDNNFFLIGIETNNKS